MEEVVVNDRSNLERIKKTIAGGGAGGLFVLADFDRTLTKAYNGKVFVSSLISVLRVGGYLAPGYSAKSQALFDRYHKIEIDEAVPYEEKKKAMKEWWTAHFELLIESGLKYGDLEKIAESGLIKLRLGCSEFLAGLYCKGIPLIILSSSGAGREGISIFLKKAGKLTDNVGIISNEFEWSPDGKAVGVKLPIIYTMNKDAAAIRDFPDARGKVQSRKNVLLLGDSVSDADMAKGFEYENLLKVGFLNERIEENLNRYKECYDVVILNDGPMDYVNSLLAELAR